MSGEARQMIDIPFNEWSETQLRNRNKWATTRTSRYGRRGDRFEAVGATWELTHVVKVPLAVVADHFYHPEGCTTRQDFIEIWEDIHYRKGFVPGWDVWLHLYREVAD